MLLTFAPSQKLTHVMSLFPSLQSPSITVPLSKLFLSSHFFFQVLLTIIDMDLGSKGEKSPVLHSTHSSSSSKFNKCFLKDLIPSTSSFQHPFSPFRGITPNVVNDDSSNSEDEEKYPTQLESEDEAKTGTDHINIFLDPDVGDEKIITLCGSIDEDENTIGQVFLSYSSSIRIDLLTKSRKFGQVYDKRRGYKFEYRFIPEHESKHGELMSITSTTRVKTETIGHVTSLNFPYAPPKGIQHKIFLRSEVGTNFELRLTKSILHLLRDGICDSTRGELTALTVKDYFGDISLYPPIPNTWSICLSNHTNNWYSETSITKKLIRGQYHEVNRIKSIQSNFHVLSIESTAFSQTPFLFLYKSSLGTIYSLFLFFDQRSILALSIVV